MIKTWQETLLDCERFNNGYELQKKVLHRFHTLCEEILSPTCGIEPLCSSVMRVESNLFSSFFLMVLGHLIESQEKLFTYGMMNQAMRAMVTGCDNILDDEFKKVIGFKLPKGGTRFQSLLTVMTGEMVLAEIALDGENGSPEFLLSMPTVVLRTLIPSGIQEHREETAQEMFLTPQQTLNDVHYYKTCLLFEAPVTNAVELGDVTECRAEAMKRGLRHLGLAAQILDDCKDIRDDLVRQRSNYVVSLAYHQNGESARARVREIAARAVKCSSTITTERHFGGDIELDVSYLASAIAHARDDAERMFLEAKTAFSDAGIVTTEDFWDALFAGIGGQILSEAVKYCSEVVSE